MRQRTGSVKFERGAWWGRPYDAAGKRVRRRLGSWPNSPEGKNRAEECARAWSERLKERGIVVATRRGTHPATPETCDAWFDAWIADRKGRGMTSTREDRSHYVHHIAPVTGGKHVRDWDHDIARAIVAALDAKVAAGTLSWEKARNVWMTAKAMARDAEMGGEFFTIETARDEVHIFSNR